MAACDTNKQLTVSLIKEIEFKPVVFEIEKSIFCCTVMILCNEKKITWSLGDMKFPFSCWLCSLVKFFSTPEEKYCIPVQSCNILYTIDNCQYVSD